MPIPMASRMSMTTRPRCALNRPWGEAVGVAVEAENRPKKRPPLIWHRGFLSVPPTEAHALWYEAPRAYPHPSWPLLVP